MKNRISSWVKRYFLWTAPTPFLRGLLIGTVPATAIVCGWTIALIVMSRLGGFDPSVDTWFSGSAFAFLGLGVVLGIVNKVVCHLFVSYRSKPGAFFAYEVLTAREIDEGRPTRGKLLAAAFGELWFRKWQKGTEICWFALPFTGRPREVKMNLGPFPVLLRITFGGEFDPEEVYSKIVRWGDHEGFDEWLCSRVLEVSKASGPVQQVLHQLGGPLEQLLSELKAPLKIALKDAGFPRVLGNIESIEFALYYTCTSIATFDLT